MVAMPKKARKTMLLASCQFLNDLLIPFWNPHRVLDLVDKSLQQWQLMGAVAATDIRARVTGDKIHRLLRYVERPGFGSRRVSERMEDFVRIRDPGRPDHVIEIIGEVREPSRWGALNLEQRSRFYGLDELREPEFEDCGRNRD